MDDEKRRSMEDRRRDAKSQGAFFTLRLLTLIRRYRMEHIKASSQTKCSCYICSEAEKILEESKTPKWG